MAIIVVSKTEGVELEQFQKEYKEGIDLQYYKKRQSIGCKVIY